jgi:hypothetical protein
VPGDRARGPCPADLGGLGAPGGGPVTLLGQDGVDVDVGPHDGLLAVCGSWVIC